MIISSQTAFWHSSSDAQKIVLVGYLGCLMKDLPVEKRPPFVRQIANSLGSLITPEDVDGLENDYDSEDEDVENKKKKDEMDLKISNQSPEGIEEKEEALRRARDKLLVKFLPTILEFYEGINDGKQLTKLSETV